MPEGEAQDDERCLIVHARSLCCALPLRQVREIMRPLPVDPIAGAPRFVLGAAVVRGAPTPVIDCGALLHSSEPPSHTRWASLHVAHGSDGRREADRTVVLAFEAITGVRALSERLDQLPPLLSGAPAEQIAHLTTLDERLLLVLQASRLVPEGLLASLEEGAA